jgi:hypothetical protein
LATVDIGAYEYPLNLGKAKTSYLVESPISLSGVVVTALMPELGCIYVERADRSSGIRIDTSKSFRISDELNVCGTIRSDEQNGECYIATTDAWPKVVTSTTPLLPFYLSNNSLGRDALGLQPGILGGQGLNNIGLWVKVCGHVTQEDPDKKYFYIDDGSRLSDGTGTSGTDNIGVRVLADGRSFTTGQMLAVTGISTCFRQEDGRIVKLLRVAGSDKIQILQ